MAIRLDRATPAGTRTILAEVLPLDTPYMIEIFPIYACNLRCNYCLMSTPRDQHPYLSGRVIMPPVMFRQCVDAMLDFQRRLKVLRFAGIGEPLLHPNIAEMVAYAKQKGVADKIEILTNATTLDARITDQLIEAGVSRLVISIQGTTSKKYREVCDRDVDVEKLVKDIGYFHDKGVATVYVKTVDTALEGSDDEKRFYEMFDTVADMIAVERTVPIHPVVEYDKILRSDSEAVTQYGGEAQDARVCPRPFMSMHVIPDGSVIPCYSLNYPTILGNVRRQNLAEIWSGEKMRRFRLKMLGGSAKHNKVCKECRILKHRYFPEENLDAEAKRLRAVYTEAGK